MSNNNIDHTPANQSLTVVPPTFRWRQSLYFRVVLLCGVLLLCLFATLMVIMNYFLNEAIQEMEAQADDIIHTLHVKLEETPDITDTALLEDMAHLYEGYSINIHDAEQRRTTTTFTLMRDTEGFLAREIEVPLQLGNRQAFLNLHMQIQPQTEIVRAIRSRYMLAVTGVFILTLGLMLYFIAKAMQPLSELSGSCAAISSGDLRTVRTGSTTGEIKALETTFNQMVHSLREKEIVEAKLRQAQRLSALGNLAAGVAHDVRNPLNAIKLLSSHAVDSLSETPAAPAARALHTINNEVNRLEEIVSSFLSLAKESELRTEPHRVDVLLSECLHLIKKDAEARNIRLLGELHAGDVTLLLDPKQWNRAILNILLNALEACPPEGRVRIFSRVTDQTCEVEIRDDGPGLSREEAERVFEPYYTTKPGGTGLGLSITRGILEEHGGRIELTSTPGQGCQVLIIMPLQRTSH